MALSKRIRFEVFKRDEFTCQYCGRKTPDVVLEVDHIVPKVEGGGDEPENLVTACFDCNRGKAGEPLDTKAALVDLSERTRLIREREEQIRAYNEAKQLERERLDAAFSEAWNYWFDLNHTKSLDYWLVPKESFLRHFVRRLPLEEVKEAMEIAVGLHWQSSRAPRYFGGICRSKIAEHEGRVRLCPGCHQRLVLDPGDDPAEEWWHGSCLAKDEKERGLA